MWPDFIGLLKFLGPYQRGEPVRLFRSKRSKQRDLREQVSRGHGLSRTRRAHYQPVRRPVPPRDPSPLPPGLSGSLGA